ncbi:MAG: TMEM175 family protein [Pricia sp.]
MKTGRLEGFSDGVLAIIITIMVLELEIPEDYSFKALRPMLPKFLTYILSFIYLGIYWNNHHHLFQAAKQVSGNILWANLNLLFWLSLLPFATGWMGENHFEANPTAMYGAVLLMAVWAFKVLVYCVVKDEGKESRLGKVYSRDKKLDISLLLYLIGIVLSFFQPIISLAIYLIVALIWIVPDPRIERNLKE